jgi:predicted RNase H-like HicB family nuclease
MIKLNKCETERNGYEASVSTFPGLTFQAETLGLLFAKIEGAIEQESMSAQRATEPDEEIAIDEAFERDLDEILAENQEVLRRLAE